MVVNNIKESLVKSVNKSWKKEIIIKSIIWNTIIEEFFKIKNIDIKDYLKSIKIIWNVIIVKTGKPILNREILNYENIFHEEIEKKLKKVWLIIVNLEIKFK
jgi:hypothetical protein